MIPSISFSITPSEITNAIERSKEYEGKIDYNNKYYNDMNKEAINAYKRYKEKVVPEINVWKNKFSYENGKLSFNNLKEVSKSQDKNTYNQYLSEDERVYVFISASVPIETLRNYARAIDKLKDNRIVMVLRGCLGGCKKLIPTSRFVQKIIAPSDKEKLNVEVVIDPNLYRLYDIKMVPAFVFATGVQLDVDEGSEGNLNHIKSVPTYSSLYGDVSFDYAIEKINSRVNNSSLNGIISYLRKSWYKK